MKTSNQDKQAIGLGYVIASRLNRRCIRRDEAKIEAINTTILIECMRVSRLLGQFNKCTCNNVKARLNRQLCALDSKIAKLEHCAQNLNVIESNNVRNIEDCLKSKMWKKTKGRSRKTTRHVTLCTERTQSSVQTIRVMGESQGRESVPSYVGGVAPRTYAGFSPVHTPIVGQTGFNEIYLIKR